MFVIVVVRTFQLSLQWPNIVKQKSVQNIILAYQKPINREHQLYHYSYDPKRSLMSYISLCLSFVISGYQQHFGLQTRNHTSETTQPVAER